MHHWYVVSPVMAKVVPVLDDGSGPIEESCDVAEVDAPTKREALRIGVPLLKDWFPEARSDGRNPWAGCHAEKLECSHLGCWCRFCQPDGEERQEACPECETEHRAQCTGSYCGCWTIEELNAGRRLDREATSPA